MYGYQGSHSLLVLPTRQSAIKSLNIQEVLYAHYWSNHLQMCVHRFHILLKKYHRCRFDSIVPTQFDLVIIAAIKSSTPNRRPLFAI